MTIHRGRELYEIPGGLVCPGCHHLMLCKLSENKPEPYLEAQCTNANDGCKFRGIRHKVRPARILAEELGPND